MAPIVGRLISVEEVRKSTPAIVLASTISLPNSTLSCSESPALTAARQGQTGQGQDIVIFLSRAPRPTIDQPAND